VLPDPWRNQFFSCIANGLYDHAKDVGEPYICKAGFKVVPGGYFKLETAQQQILHDQTTRAEEAESRAETLSKRVKEMEGALRKMEIIIPYQHCQTCNHFAAEIKAALALPPSEEEPPKK